jgi:hypothetical protein
VPSIGWRGKRSIYKDMWYQLKKRTNEKCPIPGCRNRPTDPHHTFFRRKPDRPELWCPENITMVCHYHHVPETSGLGYHCTRYKFKQGMTPEQIEKWAGSIATKAPVHLPEFYYEARFDEFGY